MHVRELVDLAGWLVLQSPSAAGQPLVISKTALNHYWAQSRCRLDRWGCLLKGYATRCEREPQQAGRAWRALRPVLEEILVSEILTRVWAAIVTHHEEQAGGNELTPITQNVLLGHADARHRALQIVMHGGGHHVEAVELNRLRRRVEQWNDVLIAALGCRFASREAAFDPDRADALTEELLERDESPTEGAAAAWMLASLRAAFAEGLAPQPANADLNRQIAASLLMCLDGTAFDDLGLPRAAWLARLSSRTADAQGLIEEALFDVERTTVFHAGSGLRRPHF